MQELVGKTDYDLAPENLAIHYRADDDGVLKGNAVNDRLELIGGTVEVEWFLTSKWPISTKDGKIIGTCGISRHLNRAQAKAVPFHELSTPIDYIRQHFADAISIQDLATACNLSISALERRFRKHLNKTPHQYLTEVRLENAQGLLQHTQKSIGIIALETGFTDHSHFTRVYKKQFGSPPSTAR
jgi:AraC-like DNA-binding protein